MVDVAKFQLQLEKLSQILKTAKTVLVTSPGAADGDSIGAQLALRQMLAQSFSFLSVSILNDEVLPQRYRFLPGAETVYCPETFPSERLLKPFDVAIIVDGGIDRAGRVKEIFDRAQTRVFIDHHAVSIEYPYTLRIVEPTASSTTELMYHISQTDFFRTKVDANFAQQIYLGLVFDTGFFRHSNTTPQVMELGAKLLRTGFDFTRVGERGMLERSFSSLKMMAEVVSKSELRSNGKIIWSTLLQDTLQKYQAVDDDREGIIDHLFLTHGIEVAVLFFELGSGFTKVSFRSQGGFNVAKFARSLTEHGGGHTKAAGALIEHPAAVTATLVLDRLEAEIQNQ